MRRIHLISCRYDKNTIPGAALIGCWIAGTSLGFCAECVCGDAYASFLPSLAGCLPEVGGVLAAACFPLLASACAVFLFRSAGCYAGCVLRGLNQGFLMGLISRCYGVAAPLMACLLGFSGLWVNGVLLCYWLRRLRLGLRSFPEDTLLCLGLCGAVGALDRLIIAPFLVDVINL